VPATGEAQDAEVAASVKIDRATRG
jgi:hypothetical protein